MTSSAGRKGEVATAQDADVTPEAPTTVRDGPEATSNPAPAGAASSIDRATALEEGAPGVPPNFVFWVLGAVLVLSLGGLLAEHLFSAVGLNPQAAASTTSTTARSAATTAPRPRHQEPSPPVSAQDQSLQAPLAAFMGLSTPRPSPTPSFTLTGVGGNTVSVPTRPPSVVVLTFFDATCNDICPVLASEIRGRGRRPRDAGVPGRVRHGEHGPGCPGRRRCRPGSGRHGSGLTAQLAHGHGPAGRGRRRSGKSLRGVDLARPEHRARGPQRRDGLRGRTRRPALPCDTVRRRELDRVLQPARGERGALGSEGSRHTREG